MLKKYNIIGAICKSRNEESGNGMKGIMGMRAIRVGMRGISVVMRGTMVRMPGFCVGMRGISAKMQGIGVGKRGMRVGMHGIRVRMRGIGGGNVEGDKNKKKWAHYSFDEMQLKKLIYEKQLKKLI